ncbi:MAG TPA: hypothetical protein VFZ49_11260, partial [Pyrinomonadaceae bacterium]
MPSIEIMQKDLRAAGIRPVKVFNVSASVGTGGANKAGDVMLVQCMFATLMHYRSKTHLMVGKDSGQPPVPNGLYTPKLGRLILEYQRLYSVLLLSVDGRISPASFAGRVLRSGGNIRRMTIQMLNENLGETSALLGGSWFDGVDLTIKTFPQLKALVT